MASQSKHKAEAQSKRQPLPDFEQDDQDEDYVADAFYLEERERAQQQERKQ